MRTTTERPSHITDEVVAGFVDDLLRALERSGGTITGERWQPIMRAIDGHEATRLHLVAAVHAWRVSRGMPPEPFFVPPYGE